MDCLLSRNFIYEFPLSSCFWIMPIFHKIYTDSLVFIYLFCSNDRHTFYYLVTKIMLMHIMINIRPNTSHHLHSYSWTMNHNLGLQALFFFLINTFLVSPNPEQKTEVKFRHLPSSDFATMLGKKSTSLLAYSPCNFELSLYLCSRELLSIFSLKAKPPSTNPSLFPCTDFCPVLLIDPKR